MPRTSRHTMKTKQLPREANKTVHHCTDYWPIQHVTSLKHAVCASKRAHRSPPPKQLKKKHAHATLNQQTTTYASKTKAQKNPPFPPPVKKTKHGSAPYRVFGCAKGHVHDSSPLGVVDLLPREHSGTLAGQVRRFRKVEEHVLPKREKRKKRKKRT